MKSNAEKLRETQKTLSQSLGQYSDLLDNKITEEQLDSALNIDDLQLSAPQDTNVRIWGVPRVNIIIQGILLITEILFNDKLRS